MGQNHSRRKVVTQPEPKKVKEDRKRWEIPSYIPTIKSSKFKRDEPSLIGGGFSIEAEQYWFFGDLPCFKKTNYPSDISDVTFPARKYIEVDHPNLLKIYGVTLGPYIGSTGGEISVVHEAYKDLMMYHYFIYHRKRKIPLEQKIEMLSGFCDALLYQQRVIFPDIISPYFFDITNFYFKTIESQSKEEELFLKILPEFRLNLWPRFANGTEEYLFGKPGIIGGTMRSRFALRSLQILTQDFHSIVPSNEHGRIDGEESDLGWLNDRTITRPLFPDLLLDDMREKFGWVVNLLNQCWNVNEEKREDRLFEVRKVFAEHGYNGQEWDRNQQFLEDERERVSFLIVDELQNVNNENVVEITFTKNNQKVKTFRFFCQKI